jgi:hypothetical protein
VRSIAVAGDGSHCMADTAWQILHAQYVVAAQLLHEAHGSIDVASHHVVVATHIRLEKGSQDILKLQRYARARSKCV